MAEVTERLHKHIEAKRHTNNIPFFLSGTAMVNTIYNFFDFVNSGKVHSPVVATVTASIVAYSALDHGREKRTDRRLEQLEAMAWQHEINMELASINQGDTYRPYDWQLEEQNTIDTGSIPDSQDGTALSTQV